MSAGRLPEFVSACLGDQIHRIDSDCARKVKRGRRIALERAVRRANTTAEWMLVVLYRELVTRRSVAKQAKRNSRRK